MQSYSVIFSKGKYSSGKFISATIWLAKISDWLLNQLQVFFPPPEQLEPKSCTEVKGTSSAEQIAI